MELADFEKMEQIRARVESVVEDPATAETLKPWYRQFCKRPCFHDEYLETFNRPNVTLVDTEGKGVERITEKRRRRRRRRLRGRLPDLRHRLRGRHDYTRRAGYDIVGRDGVSLTDKWARRYAHVPRPAEPRFPNCFFLGFTQSAFTVNVPHMLDEQARHLTYILEPRARRRRPRVEVTEEAEAEWVRDDRRPRRDRRRVPRGRARRATTTTKASRSTPRKLARGPCTAVARSASSTSSKSGEPTAISPASS